MSPSNNASEEVVLGPPPITPGGTYTLQTVSVGCKIFIRRPGPDGETEERLAEILSIRDRAANPSARNKEVKQEDPADKWEFFVHWDTFNKRLDEWVAGSRLILSRDLEWPRPKVIQPKKQPPAAKDTNKKVPSKAPKNQLLRKATTKAASISKSPLPITPSFSASPSPRPLKRKLEEEEEEFDGDEDADAEGEMDVDAEFDLSLSEPAPSTEPPDTFSKEQEIEKLRTSGSMTQSVSEIARVKNLNRIQIGKHEVDAWYFSPYPKEYAHLPVLYICEFCLCFFPSEFMLSRHRTRCTLLHPPGNEIYRCDDISFYEIDGKRQLTWCRNLSLLSKCFLDHKTLYYDVTPFMYYVMVQRDSAGCHVIGYFSKEKESAENYNVACILTLPQHQRYGYGKLLIEFSYELSKKEGKLGSPEKPLSDLGLLGYRSYWADTILELLMKHTDGDMSIDDIAQKTSITHADITNTYMPSFLVQVANTDSQPRCATLGLFKHYKGTHIICLSDAVVERYEKSKAKRKRRIDPECLRWKPPVFTRDQLRFGF
ncbi:Histone acetyltransferase [Mycena indigotica]|uniref:Histone acetyltransferase ESA1 n=1 Tax=Mycena indigotica TaxID=2126181 RepID=A0A8H6WF53_9AGAR|nr:Histone acetyltransferase [Mycena indigotica]KAF7315482.1 Histone acetyltransferase [Mycena indigotica]